MTPAQIFEGLTDKNRLLSEKNDEYKKLVESRSDFQYSYRVAKAKAVMAAREEGHSIGLIGELVRGDKNVAGLKRDYEIALGIERACLESIKDTRSAIDTYRSLLTWLRAEMTGG